MAWATCSPKMPRLYHYYRGHDTRSQARIKCVDRCSGRDHTLLASPAEEQSDEQPMAVAAGKYQEAPMLAQMED